MIMLLTPNAQAKGESQWIEVARLDSVALLLQTQGVLDRKHQKGHWVWRVRYTDKGNARRRTIDVGTDPELARRVQELLNHYRELHALGRTDGSLGEAGTVWRRSIWPRLLDT